MGISGEGSGVGFNSGVRFILHFPCCSSCFSLFLGLDILHFLVIPCQIQYKTVGLFGVFRMALRQSIQGGFYGTGTNKTWYKYRCFLAMVAYSSKVERYPFGLSKTLIPVPAFPAGTGFFWCPGICRTNECFRPIVSFFSVKNVAAFCNFGTVLSRTIQHQIRTGDAEFRQIPGRVYVSLHHAL